MAKLPYMNDGNDYGEPDEPGSYFEEQCRKADRGDTYAQMEVDAMVEANNNALAQELSMATAPVHQIDDDYDDSMINTNGSFSGSFGIGSNTLINTTVIGNTHTTASGGPLYTFHTNPTSQCDELPSFTFNGYDFEGKKITMIFKPEATISTLEVLKIMLLINAAANSPSKFSVYAYIKKNNLERHFKFTQ